MIKLQNYFPVDEDTINAIINNYELKYIRYDNEIFTDLEELAYDYCPKTVAKFQDEFIEYLFKYIAKKHIHDLFSFFVRGDESNLPFFNYTLRRISNRSELLDITEEALVYPHNLNVFLNLKIEPMEILMPINKIELYKQILLSYVHAQWFDWYFERFDINNIDKKAVYKDYFISIFIKDYLDKAFYLIQYIDNISILNNDIFHEDITPYIPNWNDEQQVNSFYERLKSFLIMREISNE